MTRSRRTPSPKGAHRRALTVDTDVKAKHLACLGRIEGQVRGLHGMVEEERYRPDILIEISSVHEALRAVARKLMRNHLKHGATQAIRGQAEAIYDELIDLKHRHSQ